MSDASDRVLSTDYTTKENAPRLYGEAILLAREVEALESKIDKLRTELWQLISTGIYLEGLGESTERIVIGKQLLKIIDEKE